MIIKNGGPRVNSNKSILEPRLRDGMRTLKRPQAVVTPIISIVSGKLSLSVNNVLFKRFISSAIGSSNLTVIVDFLHCLNVIWM